MSEISDTGSNGGESDKADGWGFLVAQHGAARYASLDLPPCRAGPCSEELTLVPAVTLG